MGGQQSTPIVSQTPIFRSLLQNISDDIDLDTYDNEAAFFSEPLLKVTSKNMHDRLHRFIGAIHFQNKANVKKVGRGTGLLISPNLVLTAARNIYDVQLGIDNTEIKFYLGQCGRLERFYTIKSYFMPSDYKIDQTAKNNYALLMLAEPIQEKQFIELRGDSTKLKKQTTLAIFGYPKAVQNQEKKETQTAFQFGLIKNKALIYIREEKGDIVYSMSTQLGQNGAPIIEINEQGKLAVVGIHCGKFIEVTSSGKAIANAGRLLTPRIIQTLQEQARKMGAIMFNVSEENQNIDYINLHLCDDIQRSEQCSSQNNVKNVQKQHLISKKMREEEIFLKKEQDLLIEINNQSIQMYKKAIQLDPTDHLPYYNMAVVLKNHHKIQLAIKYYQKALEINPSFFEAYNNLGVALRNVNKTEEAIQYFRESIQICPTFIEAYNNLGLALADMKKIDEAIQCYKKAIQIDPNNYNQVYYNYGNILKDIDEKEEAVKHYVKAIQIWPEDSQAYNNMGIAFDGLGKKEEALESYCRATQINPHFSESFFNLGVVLNKMKQYYGAIECFTKVVELNPNFPGVFLGLGNTLMKVKQYKSSKDCYHKAIYQNPNDSRPYLRLIQLLQEKNQMQKVFVFFEQIIKAQPNCVSAKQAYKTLRNKIATAV